MWYMYIILSIWSVPWMNEALKLHPNDVNMTAIEARLDGMEHELSQEKALRKDLEKKLEHSTKILENTVLLLQQERNTRQNLESKLDDTINLLQNTSVALQMEENLRKKIESELEDKITILKNTTKELQKDIIFNATCRMI